MSPCSKISACGLALLPPPSTSGHLMGAWGHRSQFFCALHVATVLSTFGLHCTLYTIPVPGQVGLWQRPGTWAWLALLCLARPCIHFSSWSAACLWLRKQTSTVFYLPRGLQRVAMSSLLFFFSTLRTPWRSCLSHVALHGAVGLAVSLSWYHLFHCLPGRESEPWGHVGGLFQSHFSPRLQLHGDHGRLLLPHLPTAGMEVSTLSALWSPLIRLNPARGVWIVLF